MIRNAIFQISDEQSKTLHQPHGKMALLQVDSKKEMSFSYHLPCIYFSRFGSEKNIRPKIELDSWKEWVL